MNNGNVLRCSNRSHSDNENVARPDKILLDDAIEFHKLINLGSGTIGRGRGQKKRQRVF